MLKVVGQNATKKLTKYLENLPWNIKSIKSNHYVQINVSPMNVFSGSIYKMNKYLEANGISLFLQRVGWSHPNCFVYFSWRSHERNPFFPIKLNRPTHLFPEVTHESSMFCERSFTQEKKKNLKNKHSPACCLGLNWEYLAYVPYIFPLTASLVWN